MKAERAGFRLTFLKMVSAAHNIDHLTFLSIELGISKTISNSVTYQENLNNEW